MKFILTISLFVSLVLNSSFALAVCNSSINLTKPNSIYTDNGDGTVTDSETSLTWKKCLLGLSGNICMTGASKKLTWQAALKAANDNTENGYSDWRLPNKNELISIMETACESPAINESVFPATATGAYWTSSPSSNISAYAWFVVFNEGKVDNSFAKDQNYYVRLVRGGD